MWRWMLAFVAIAGPAQSEMIRSAVPVEVLASGGHCDRAPDVVVKAPTASGGQYERIFRPADYVVRGDRFPAQVGLGIGVRVRISGYGPGRTVTVLIIPPEGNRGSWEQTVNGAGDLDFGRLPAFGEALPEGRYLLSAMDDGRYLFTYAITLEGAAEESLCVPVS